MPLYKHSFICSYCYKHVTFTTLESVPIQPGRTHSAALEAGAAPAGAKDKADGCIGTLEFCAGFNRFDNMKRCASGHKGTLQINDPPPPKPNPEWNTFAAKVTGAWDAFVASGYSKAKRGANNNREYRAPAPVKGLLQGAGGVVKIGAAVYTIEVSLTAGVSLHRPIPAARQQGHVRSFIFHL